MKQIFIQVLAIACAGLLSCNKNDLSDARTEKQSKDADASNWLVFGEYYGFCPPESDCARVYKMENGQLYIDTIKRMGDAKTPITFNEEQLPSERYEKSKKLLQSLPEELLTSQEEVFGSPDSHDQGGIVIETIQNGKVKRFYIDMDSAYLPEFIKPYAEEVKEVLKEIK